MKVVILCGGRGTRLREETEYRPKPMVDIGERPILWHIMKTYAHYGFKDFILCLGYKGEMIRHYFRNYRWNSCDTTLSLGKEPKVTFLNQHDEEDWNVTLAETGAESLTGERILRIKPYIGDDENFFLTYGDGVGNVDIAASLAAHKQAGKVCTLTAVHPPGRFGELNIDADHAIRGFNEKPQTEAGYINGGYMVCRRDVFDYLEPNHAVMFEQEPIRKIVSDGQLRAFHHEGFWQPMDTYQEYLFLNGLWNKGQAPWKVW